MIKAFAVHEPKGELKPFEYDPGPLKDTEVEIDIDFCGICHSDAEYMKERKPLLPVDQLQKYWTSEHGKLNSYHKCAFRD